MHLDKCMLGHIFAYQPNSSSVYMREYFCSCSNCLELKFENCESLITANFDETVVDLNQCENESSNSEDECTLDEDFENGNNHNVFDFIILPSYIALITGNMLQPVYILKIFEKGKSSTKMHDKYGHVILPDELYLKGNYLVKNSRKNINKRKFRILDDPVLVTPDESRFIY